MVVHVEDHADSARVFGISGLVQEITGAVCDQSKCAVERSSGQRSASQTIAIQLSNVAQRCCGCTGRNGRVSKNAHNLMQISWDARSGHLNSFRHEMRVGGGAHLDRGGCIARRFNGAERRSVYGLAAGIVAAGNHHQHAGFNGIFNCHRKRVARNAGRVAANRAGIEWTCKRR